MDPKSPLYYRGFLPHFSRPGLVQTVTFRLADGLPLGARARESEEEQSVFKAYDQVLDAGFGSCLLRDRRAARCVADALRFFDGDRYDLIAWVVMPNHVHAVMKLLGKSSTSGILHS